MNNENMDTKQIILAGLFVALMAVSAWIKIPFPLVPLTFQLVIAVTAGIILGSKVAPLAMGVYIILGLIGLPIFSNGGGFGYIFQPTFGFLIGFLLSAWITGLIWNKKIISKIIAILFGILATYVVGIPWFWWASHWVFEIPFSLSKSALIMFPFLIKDIGLGAILFGMFHVYSKFSLVSENTKKGG